MIRQESEIAQRQASTIRKLRLFFFVCINRFLLIRISLKELVLNNSFIDNRVF